MVRAVECTGGGEPEELVEQLGARRLAEGVQQVTSVGVDGGGAHAIHLGNPDHRLKHGRVLDTGATEARERARNQLRGTALLGKRVGLARLVARLQDE